MIETKTQEARLYHDSSGSQLDASIQVPVFPNAPRLIRHQGSYYVAVGSDIDFGVANPDLSYIRVELFSGATTEASAGKQETRQYRDDTEGQLYATVQLPAYPNNPSLVRYRGQFYVPAVPVIGEEVSYLTYYGVKLFES